MAALTEILIGLPCDTELNRCHGSNLELSTLDQRVELPSGRRASLAVDDDGGLQEIGRRDAW